MLMIPFNLMPFLLRSSNAPAGVRLAVCLFLFLPLAHNVLTHIRMRRVGEAQHRWEVALIKGLRPSQRT